MSKGYKTIDIGIFLLTVEKMLQHLLTAFFFAFNIPGIGRPDIGPNFQWSNITLFLLNVIVLILFGLGLWGRLQNQGWHRSLLAWLALFDILAEFVFHGFFYITVSVIVAVVLLLLLQLERGYRQI